MKAETRVETLEAFESTVNWTQITVKNMSLELEKVQIDLRKLNLITVRFYEEKPASGSLGPERLSSLKHISDTRKPIDLNVTLMDTQACTQLDKLAYMQTHTYMRT